MFFKGLMVGGGLIVAVGAQNAFVLTQGIRKEFNLVIAVTCIICDILFIALGIGGVGTIVASSPLLAALAGIGGSMFLIFYGFRSFLGVFIGERMEQDSRKISTRKGAIIATLAFTLLNPHFYLDTVVLMGGISSQFHYQERIFFGVGAMTASVLWFFGLSFGSRLLSKAFKQPAAWRILDGIICLVMWYIAYTLLAQYL